MAKPPGSGGKRRHSLLKRKPSLTKTLATASSRRKFIKMAGALSAAMFLKQHAKGMAVMPKFDSKWLAAVQLGDISGSGADCDCADPDAAEWLCVTTPNQKQQQWCWVAVALGIINFYEINSSGWDQCDLLWAYRLSSDNMAITCCNYADNIPNYLLNQGEQYLPYVCRQRGWPGSILSWLHLTSGTQPSTSSITRDEMIDQIKQVRPVIIQIQEKDGQGNYVNTGDEFNHFAVIVSYDCNPGDQSDGPEGEPQTIVDIQDPKFGTHYGVPFCHIEDAYKSIAHINVGWSSTTYVCPPPGFLDA